MSFLLLCLPLYCVLLDNQAYTAPKVLKPPSLCPGGKKLECSFTILVDFDESLIVSPSSPQRNVETHEGPTTKTSECRLHCSQIATFSIVNPRRACPARVMVVVLSVCLSVCLSVPHYSRSTGNEAASKRYQQLQCNKRSKIKMVILLKQRGSRSRNRYWRGPRCVTQPINYRCACRQGEESTQCARRLARRSTSTLVCRQRVHHRSKRYVDT